MKTIKLLVYSLIVCMSFVSVAEAKGRSGSFKSGFSSQKRAAAKPAQPSYQEPPANTQTKNTAFGSFNTGNAANPKLDQKSAIPQSQISKDLNGTAAQGNALKTVDTRNKSTEKVNDANSETGWFRSGSQNTVPPKTNTMAGGGQAPQSSGYQAQQNYNNGRQSNGLLYGLMGFMVGHSLAQQHNNEVAPQANQNAGQTANQVDGQVNTGGVVLQQEQAVPVMETESFFMKLLRVVLWVVMISGVVWVIRKCMNFRKPMQRANYSLRS